VYFHQTEHKAPLLAQTKLPRKSKGVVTASRLHDLAQKGNSKLFKNLISMEGKVC